jgi:hypothetical protein
MSQGFARRVPQRVHRQGAVALPGGLQQHVVQPGAGPQDGVGGMPTFWAIWSAVLNPMPWMSLARQYGSAWTRSMAR